MDKLQGLIGTYIGKSAQFHILDPTYQSKTSISHREELSRDLASRDKDIRVIGVCRHSGRELKGGVGTIGHVVLVDSWGDLEEGEGRQRSAVDV